MARRSGIWQIVLACVLILVALCAGAYVIWERMGAAEAAASSIEISKKALAAPAQVSGESALVSEEDGWSYPIDENLLRRIDFNELQSINSDVARWIWVPGTAIDGPVMQEQTVGYWHYDRRDMYGNPNQCGSYLMPALPEGQSDGHTIILGHLMGSLGGEWQFSHLRSRWGSKEGAEEFPYVYLYYPDHSERWRVWAGCDASAYDSVYDLGIELGSDSYENLIGHMSELARYETAGRPDRWRKTLMISTCQRFASGELGRFFIVCVLDRSYDYETSELVDEEAAHTEQMWVKGYQDAYETAYAEALAAEEAAEEASQVADNGVVPVSEESMGSESIEDNIGA